MVKRCSTFAVTWVAAYVAFAVMADLSPAAKAQDAASAESPATSTSPAQQASDPARQRAYAKAALVGEGNPERGRALFQDKKLTKCAICHKVQDKGGDVGPDLTHVAGKFGRPHLIESLLEPSRQILEGFRTSLIVDTSGRVITGVVRGESPESLTLFDAEGKPHLILASEVDEREESDVSLMPLGLADSLSSAQFVDLIAYLETLRPAGKASRGEKIFGGIQVPEDFDVEMVATGLTGATAMETAADGRIFVCEQTGTVRIVKDGKLLAEPFVTLPVEAYWERGVIGVTVHPDFPATPYVYICYTAAEPYPHHHVSRFTADGDVAVAGSEVVLFRGDDQRTLGGKVPAGHQGGALHFGIDGKLYIAIGEQTSKTPSQDLDSLLGKILRINPDGSIPDDNPFAASAEGKYRAIWARGLRNPFTFAIQGSTGTMLINDVGEEHEEVNRGEPGANFGWPLVDGPTDDSRFRDPVHFYPHASLAGADFSADDHPWPARYRGRYFFADFVHGWIHTLDPQRTDDVEPFAARLPRPVDLRFAADGDLYVLSRNAWVIDDKFEPGTGSLLRIRYATNESAANDSPGSFVAASTGLATIKLTRDAFDASAGGLPAYRIETPAAVYYLEKSGAGLSSMVDRDGVDWLGFHPQRESGSAGEYRGFPNAVHQQGGNFFHPRNAATDPSTSRVEHIDNHRISISVQSSNGLWAGRYDFFATHCTFTMTRMPADRKYWVLYEGAPGGSYDHDDWWMTSGMGEPRPLSEKRDGDLAGPEWIAFGDRAMNRALLLVHHEDDEHPDDFYPMREQMTVFGFGRRRVEKFLDSVPQQFSIGFVEHHDRDRLAEAAAAMLRNPGRGRSD